MYLRLKESGWEHEMREVLQYSITPTYLPLNEYIHLIFAIAEKL